MILGIIADSHDNLVKIEKAVRFFKRNKVNFVLHGGDFIAPFSVLKLKALTCDWCGVFGNNDGERGGLSDISAGKIKEGPLRIELGGRKIILIHDITGINPASEEADILVHGHTHKSEIKKEFHKIIINPGECGGWLSRKSTVAVADLSSLSVKICRI